MCSYLSAVGRTDVQTIRNNYSS